MLGVLPKQPVLACETMQRKPHRYTGGWLRQRSSPLWHVRSFMGKLSVHSLTHVTFLSDHWFIQDGVITFDRYDLCGHALQVTEQFEAWCQSTVKNPNFQLIKPVLEKV